MMKKLLLATTIMGSAALLSGCYDTGDQAVLDKLLNEKETAVDNARQATEELSELKKQLEALKSENAEKDKEAEEAKNLISKAAEERKQLEAKLKEEEEAREKAEKEVEEKTTMVEELTAKVKAMDPGQPATLPRGGNRQDLLGSGV